MILAKLNSSSQESDYLFCLLVVPITDHGKCFWTVKFIVSFPECMFRWKYSHVENLSLVIRASQFYSLTVIISQNVFPVHPHVCNNDSCIHCIVFEVGILFCHKKRQILTFNSLGLFLILWTNCLPSEWSVLTGSLSSLKKEWVQR